MFTIVFAVIAVITLGIAIRGWDQAGLAWVTFGMFVLSAITGLYERMLIAGWSASPTSNEAMWAEWGMITVGLAGSAGAVSAFFAARAINRF